VLCNATSVCLLVSNGLGCLFCSTVWVVCVVGVSLTVVLV
jgi:hypothetical protein